MYVVGYSSDSVHQYTLSTGFDLSTASYDNVSFSVSAQETIPLDTAFNNDGTKMFMIGNINDRVYQYTLSTGFDLSTASYDNVSFSVISQDSNPYDIEFNSDGTKMYMVGATGDKVYQYTLSTGFNISTASYDNVSFSVAGQETNPLGIAFSNDGTKLYMVGDVSDTVYQYSTTVSVPFTITYPSSVKWSGATTPDTPEEGDKDVYVFVTTDGGTTYYAKQAGDAVA